MLWIPGPAAGEDTPGQPGTRLDAGVQVQDYTWAEYGEKGRVLEETGNLFGVFCAYESRKSRIGWRMGGNLFFGQVDYDGQTWTDIPVKTDVLYVGSKLSADLVPGMRLASGVWVMAFAGLGGEFWLRDLDDTKTPDNEAVNGAREWWGSVYGRMGIGAEYKITEDVMVFSEAGLKVPVYTRNEAEFFLDNSPSVKLEPEMDVSGFGALGCRWKQWGARVTWDSLRFDPSDVVSAGNYSLYQPESKADVYSVEVFWSFWSKGF